LTDAWIKLGHDGTSPGAIYPAALISAIAFSISSSMVRRI
jgi:hypothetical protein